MASGPAIIERRNRQRHRLGLPCIDRFQRRRTSMQRLLIVTSALVALLAACSEHPTPTEVGGPSAAVVGPSLAQHATRKRPGTTVIVYDDFHKLGGYTLADYSA